LATNARQIKSAAAIQMAAWAGLAVCRRATYVVRWSVGLAAIWVPARKVRPVVLAGASHSSRLSTFRPARKGGEACDQQEGVGPVYSFPFLC